MNITPPLPDGYNNPIKQLTCRTCKQLFYLTWVDYKRLQEIHCCHVCSLIEDEAYGTFPLKNTDVTPLSPLQQQILTLLGFSSCCLSPAGERFVTSA
jgi:hypothetical protein